MTTPAAPKAPRRKVARRARGTTPATARELVVQLGERFEQMESHAPDLVELSAGERAVIRRALTLLARYDTPRQGRVRFIADAWNEGGGITVACTDPRIPGGFITSVRGAGAVAVQTAIGS